jgi:phage tail-like protein
MTMITEGVASSPLTAGGDSEELTSIATAHAACRFYVQVGEKGAALQAVFTEVSGLQVEMQVTEYEEGGTNDFVHRLPGRLKVGNVTLKRGMTVSNAFLKWCMKTNIGSLQRKNVTVVMYDVAGKPVVRWHFNKAYPVKWTGPQFTADSTAMAIESVEFTHEGLTVDPA